MKAAKPVSAARRVLDKVAVKNQSGLSTAQLMLVNEDLKPGMSFPLW
jgi:hypothetical protein